VLDRASTFADPEIVKLLQTRFVPVAIDQAYQRRQQDSEGEFYRKIAGQGPRNNFQGTTQGLYIATADGTLLSFSNNRGAERIRRLMKEALAAPKDTSAKVVTADQVDPRFNPQPPAGGLVVRVRAKVLGGYEETEDQWRQIFQSAVSRDNLWISNSEHQALVRGDVPKSLQNRIAKFHLVDNTRGEPPMWQDQEVRDVSMTLTGNRLSGKVHLETKNGQRGYQADLLGLLDVKDGQVVRFDVVARGDFWGDGPYTKGAPRGKFPLAVSFELADGSDVADDIPPQASRGWVAGYIR
jgi:hypothetical protein